MKTFIFKAESTNFCGFDETIEVVAETFAEAESEADEIAAELFAYSVILEEVVVED